MSRRSGGTLIELLTVLAVAGVLFGLLLPAVQRARAVAARLQCGNHLRSLALAAHGHHDAVGRLPPGTHGRSQAAPRLRFFNWHAHLLPFLDQGPLANVVAVDQPAGPWVYPPPGREVVVPVYGCPADPRTAVAWDVSRGAGNRRRDIVALTSYLGNAGTDYRSRDGVLYLDSAVTLAGVTDGTTSTILAGERPPSPEVRFGWWHSGIGQAGTGVLDGTLGAAEVNGLRGSHGPYPACPPGPYRYRPGRVEDYCDAFHFWSLHPGGANFALCDGSVRFLPYSVDALLPALATRAGAEVAALD